MNFTETLHEEEKRITAALSGLRVPAENEEYDLHRMIAQALEAAGVEFRHECPLFPRARIDFMVGRTGIEVKKGAPVRRTLISQIYRYMQSEKIDQMIVVTQKNISLPGTIGGKRVIAISLNRFWGVALP